MNKIIFLLPVLVAICACSTTSNVADIWSHIEVADKIRGPEGNKILRKPALLRGGVEVNKGDSTLPQDEGVYSLVALYGGMNQRLLYNGDYGLITNNLKNTSVEEIGASSIQDYSYRKLHHLSFTLHYLDSKYHILPRKIKKLVTIVLNNNFIYQNSPKYLKILTYATKDIPLLFPIHNPRVTSNFGLRFHPVRKRRILHTGIDLVNRETKEIFSAAAGEVISVCRLRGYGNTVVIKHNKKMMTKYAHLQSISVKRGQKIERGEKIGIEGRTGTATAMHLHYEIIINNKVINPHDFLFASKKFTGQKLAYNSVIDKYIM